MFLKMEALTLKFMRNFFELIFTFLKKFSKKSEFACYLLRFRLLIREPHHQAIQYQFSVILLLSAAIFYGLLQELQGASGTIVCALKLLFISPAKDKK